MTTRFLMIPALLLFSLLPLAAGEPEPTVFTKLFPPGASLEAHGTEMELLAVNGTYRAYSISPGYHRLTLSADGYRKKTLSVTVSDGLLLEEKLERIDSFLDLLGEFPSGKQPKSAAFSPDGRFLVVPFLSDRGVGLYGTDPFRYIGVIDIPEEYSSKLGFVESAFMPEKDELWVSQMTTGLIHVIDTVSWKWKRVYRTGGLWSKVITPSPDGSYCCISNWVSRTVSFLDAETGTIRAVVPVGGIPRGMVFNKDGSKLYVCLFDTGDIDVIDCKNYRVSSTLELGPGAARHVIADHEKGRIFFTDMYNGTVVSVSMDTGRLLSRRYVGSNPNTLVLSPDGTRLYVSVRGRNNRETYLREGPEYGKVLVLNAETLKLIDWTWGRNQPTGLAVSPDGATLVFTDFLDAAVEVYRLEGPLSQ